MLADAVVLACALTTGVAIQRGNTCTVVAVRDLLQRRDPTRALAILHAMAWVAGLAACAVALFGFAWAAPAFAANAAVVVGGALLGLGAIVNGACAVGTIARLGNGEWAWLLTLPGMLLGSLVYRLVPAPLTPQAIALTPPLHDVAWIAALAFAGYVLWLSPQALRRFAGAGGLLRGAWHPTIATTAIAVAFVLASAAVGPWAYTAMIDRFVDGRFGEGSGMLLPFAALVGGAVAAGAIGRGEPRRRATAQQRRNCLVGGAIMGLGGRLAGGGFDAHTLLGQPLSLPHAWTAMGAAYAVVAAVTLLDALRGRRS